MAPPAVAVPEYAAPFHSPPHPTYAYTFPHTRTPSHTGTSHRHTAHTINHRNTYAEIQTHRGIGAAPQTHSKALTCCTFSRLLAFSHRCCSACSCCSCSCGLVPRYCRTQHSTHACQHSMTWFSTVLATMQGYSVLPRYCRTHHSTHACQHRTQHPDSMTWCEYI